MIIERNTYLKQLIDGIDNGLIKVITGIRRCGKSFLLSQIFRDYLIKNNVNPSNIIHIPLDDRRNIQLRNPDKFIKVIDGLTQDINQKYYLLIDEIQLMDDFIEVLNSFLYTTNIEVFVTGSNSKFLSSDIITEFRGRSDEIHMYPLSFKEYYSVYNKDFETSWKDFYTYGGLPQVVLINDESKKKSYLQNLMSTVFIKDVIERHKIKYSEEIEDLIQIIASSIGAPTNPIKLSNTFKSLKKSEVTYKTLSKYIGYLLDAFIIEKALRYDIKGKKYINSLLKYYFTDTGLRNGILNFRQNEESHLMENIIYNELLIRGYSVDVGMVLTRSFDNQGNAVRKRLEVDFVANKGDVRLYIQSALHIPNREKKIQETASLLKINDSFKKIIIVKDNIKEYMDEDGFLNIGLKDFLLNEDNFLLR